jgi:hypothetical protein
MAETEFGALRRQCSDCRISDQKTLKNKTADWERNRNRKSDNIRVLLFNH